MRHTHQHSCMEHINRHNTCEIYHHSHLGHTTLNIHVGHPYQQLAIQVKRTNPHHTFGTHMFQHSMFMWDTNINTSRSCGTHISTLTIHLRRVYINTHHSHGTNISTLTIHVGHTCIRTHHTHEAHSYDERSSYKIWAESSRGKCHTR